MGQLIPNQENKESNQDNEKSNLDNDSFKMLFSLRGVVTMCGTRTISGT